MTTATENLTLYHYEGYVRTGKICKITKQQIAILASGYVVAETEAAASAKLAEVKGDRWQGLRSLILCPESRCTKMKARRLLKNCNGVGR